ncbi:MAG: transporter [Alphaproteobacteria bacterium]|nr:transporter [Alphaproteobacteria bacterium]
MGAIGSVLGAAQAIAGTVGVVSSVVRQSREREFGLNQLRAQQDLQMASARQDAALDRQKVALDTRQAEEKRRAALKRAVARQRASFGAQGLSSSGGGSSQAVLLGLFDESEDELRRREELDNLRLNAIDQDLSQRGSLNVLQRTQLAERNKLADLKAARQAGSDIADIFR